MSEDSIDFDAVLDLCGALHRRIVLAVLVQDRRSMTLNDLTKAVVKHNHRTPITEVSGEVVRRVRRNLHHVHLPKLADGGVIEYDPDRGTVEPTVRFDRLQPQFSAVIGADPDLEPPLEL